MAFNASYVGLRSDLLSLVEQGPGEVLDVGCSTGENGRFLQERLGYRVTGVELDQVMAEAAAPKLAAVHVADLNARRLRDVVDGASFDVILFGDVLEHLIDPWTALSDARAALRDGGRVVVSAPNVCHWSTIADLLLFRRWAYRDRGIHDRTHLRFFTRKNLVELYAGCGFEIERERRNLRVVEAISKVNGIAVAFDFQPFRPYFTFQYLHRLRPAGQEAPR